MMLVMMAGEPALLRMASKRKVLIKAEIKNRYSAISALGTATLIHLLHLLVRTSIIISIYLLRKIPIA